MSIRDRRGTTRILGSRTNNQEGGYYGHYSHVSRARRRQGEREAAVQGAAPRPSQPISDDFRAVAWNGTTYVVVDEQSSAWTSPDGVTWTEHEDVLGSGSRGVTWAGTRFVAVASFSQIFTSSDGMSWVLESVGADQLFDVAWDGSQAIAVGIDTAWRSQSRFENRVVAHRTIASDEIVEACSSIEIGPQLTVTSAGSLTLRAGLKGHALSSGVRGSLESILVMR